MYICVCVSVLLYNRKSMEPFLRCLFPMPFPVFYIQVSLKLEKTQIEIFLVVYVKFIFFVYLFHFGGMTVKRFHVRISMHIPITKHLFCLDPKACKLDKKNSISTFSSRIQCLIQNR